MGKITTKNKFVQPKKQNTLANKKLDKNSLDNGHFIEFIKINYFAAKITH